MPAPTSQREVLLAAIRTFNTGMENLPDPTDDFSQPDDGLGAPGDGTFNPPSLV
ncbi:MAG: hypothetical protein ACREXX_03955 [Gammaproteobacteria bacterium]